MERTFIITGGNSGLGYQCANNIALENPIIRIVIKQSKCLQFEGTKPRINPLTIGQGKAQCLFLTFTVCSDLPA